MSTSLTERDCKAAIACYEKQAQRSREQGQLKAASDWMESARWFREVMKRTRVSA